MISMLFLIVSSMCPVDFTPQTVIAEQVQQAQTVCLEELSGILKLIDNALPPLGLGWSDCPLTVMTFCTGAEVSLKENTNTLVTSPGEDKVCLIAIAYGGVSLDGKYEYHWRRNGKPTGKVDLGYLSIIEITKTEANEGRYSVRVQDFSS